MNTDIKIETTDKHLSSRGGLHLFSNCWSGSAVAGKLALPNVRNSLKKFEDMALGFAADAQCLDDMANLAKDEGFRAVCHEKLYTPKYYGDYLRAFSHEDIEHNKKALARSAFEQRAKVTPKMESMTFDLDSTTNRQYAEVMEGVCFSGEKKYDCLTTMYVFDELGYQYYSDVRPGNTHTSDQIAKIIHTVLSQMPKEGSYKESEINLPWQVYTKKLRVYARADAGYSNNEFITACLAKDVGFVVRLHWNMLEPKLKNITNWKPTKKKVKKVKRRNGTTEEIDTTIRFYDGREAEIGATLYQNEYMPKACRIVCLRAKKKGRLGLTEDDYDYFAWLTSIGEHEMSNEKIILFYRKRGHAENYIREVKNGLDLHHYPCLKLNANRAYALIAAFSYNTLRTMSLACGAKKAQFAKAIRNKFINLPCQVVRTGGKVFFRFMNAHAKEVKRLLKTLKNLQYGFT